MELLQLQYFCKVAKLEHMTKAAKELHIAQPALSKTISRLEEHVGVPLFDRNGRQIQLNAFGKAFLKKVEAALNLLEEGQRELIDLAGMERGRVMVATTTHKCFSEMIGSFMSLHPDVQMRITQASSEEKEQQLQKGEIDFCITFPPLEQDGIDGVNILTEEIMLAVPPTHHFASRDSIDLAEVAHEPFICIKEGNPFRAMTDAFCQQAGFAPNIVCEVDEHSAISHFLHAGIGIAFLPETLGDKVNSFRLIRLERPFCQRTYQLAWRKDRYLSVASHTFRDYVISYCAGLQKRSAFATTEE
ncbi:LysR family transcriptional regulator [Brevibacillus choshinensis]|uniref:LysR family transcriptional regulator n=1 Tax=Brevibacillus choshinensis TaxID=54911 RepID=UPI002E1A7DDE|nr:LysR family transcriptional regulator [Brevibacillus choshinensis]